MCHIPIFSTLSYQEPELPARPAAAILIPSPPDLSHSFLVKQAASCTLESSLSLLTRSLASYLEFCQHHAHNLDSLAGQQHVFYLNLTYCFSNYFYPNKNNIFFRKCLVFTYIQVCYVFLKKHLVRVNSVFLK